MCHNLNGFNNSALNLTELWDTNGCQVFNNLLVSDNSDCHARLWLTPALIFNIPATRQPQPLSVLLKLAWNKSTQYPNIHTNHITLTLLFTWQKPYCVILQTSAKDMMKFIQIYLMFYIIHLMLILRATILPYRSDYFWTYQLCWSIQK